MFALFYDESGTLGYKGIIQNEEANQVSVSSVPKNEKPIAYLFCNLDAYSVYCKDYREYWKWVAERNEDRYNVNQTHGQNYDSKNIMHTIRLLQSCEALAGARGMERLLAGVNTARHDAHRMMIAQGFRPLMEGIAMQWPDAPGLHRPDCFVIDDYR